MKYLNMNFFIILVALAIILLASFALISSSQSNEASSDTNQTFASISRDLAENQSEDGTDQQPDD
jgi:hypothetical protein